MPSWGRHQINDSYEYETLQWLKMWKEIPSRQIKNNATEAAVSVASP